jgi:hypothetical protein
MVLFNNLTFVKYSFFWGGTFFPHNQFLIFIIYCIYSQHYSSLPSHHHQIPYHHRLVADAVAGH